jgi:hypothetical protein
MRFVSSFALLAVTLFTTTAICSAQSGSSANYPSIKNQTIGGTAGVALTAQIQATNATEYKIVNGTLPAGLVLDAATGAITGTPTAAQTTSVTVQIAETPSTSATVVFAICDPSQGAPTFTVTDYENAFRFPGNIPGHDMYGFSVGNHPSSITATGVPPGVAFEVLIQLGEVFFSWTDDAFTGGDFPVTVTATNGVGTTQKTFHWIIHPGVSNFIKSDRTSYTVGDTITLTAPFSAPVVVTGTPAIPLWGTKRALYAGGSGTSALTFQYVVAADDSPGSYFVDHIELNGGVIAMSNGVTAVSLWAGRTIVGPPPGFSIVAPPLPATNQPPVFDPVPDRDDSYGEFGNTTVMASSRIAVKNASASVTATGLPPGVIFSGSTTEASFLWTVDDFTGGEYPVTLTATNAAGSTTAKFMWIVHPGLVLYINNDRRSYSAGDTISFTARFSAPVVVTGAPYIPLWGSRRAVYASGSGTDTLTFQYTVVSEDGPQANVHVTRILLGDGSIRTPGGTSAGKLSVQEHIGMAYPTFDIAAPPATTPPVSTQTPPAETPSAPVTTRSTPTITFSSPVGAIRVGQPVTLGALSSAGLPISYTVVSGDATLNGDVLTAASTATLIVRAATGATDQYNATSTDVNFGNPQKAAQAITVSLPPSIATSTNSATVHTDTPVTLAGTTTSGLPVTYSVVNGPATVSGATLTFTGTGNVTVRASQPGDGAYAPAQDVTLTFTANPIDRLVNLSSRLRVTAGDASTGAIAGFVVTGSSPKQLLIRAVGPTLSSYGVTAPLADPHLQVFDSKGVSLATNAGWGGDSTIASTAESLGAFKLYAGSRDAALLLTVPPGSYTAQVSSPSNSGTVLVEVYDVGANAAVPTKQLINISTRGVVGTGDDAIVAGFVVAGVEPKRVLIRGVGPALSAYGVAGVLADPMLKLFDAQGTVLARNDNWEATTATDALHFTTTAADVSAANTAAGAFALAAGSRDSVLVLTLNPGTYTAQVSGVNNSTGAALVEVYELP